MTHPATMRSVAMKAIHMMPLLPVEARAAGLATWDTTGAALGVVVTVGVAEGVSVGVGVGVGVTTTAHSCASTVCSSAMYCSPATPSPSTQVQDSVSKVTG